MQNKYLMCVIMLFYGFIALRGADFLKEREEIKSGNRKDARAEWWGFNSTDSTAILQAALNSGISKLTISKQSTPWVISRTLNIPSNIEIIFEKGAEIQAKSGCFEKINEMLLQIMKRKNVKLRGPGLITMRRGDYQDKAKYKPSEWRHTLGIIRSSDILIDGLTFSKSGGDGIYINKVNNITIDNIACSDNHRQGITIISASNLLIKNSSFVNTRGTPPTAGIDFEPNRWTESLKNCRVENCNFINNAGSGIEIMLLKFNRRSKPISLAFSNCLIKNNQKGITIFNRNSSAVRGDIIFENCKIEGSKSYSFMTYGQTADGYSVTLKNCILDNSKSIDPVAVEFIAGYVSGALGNLHVNKLKVIDPRPESSLFHFDSWKFAPLKKLSGIIKHQSGRTFDLKEAVKRSQKVKPFKNSEVDCKNLVPVKTAIASNLKTSPPRNRSFGIFVQYAKKSQKVNIAINIMPIGGKEGIKVSGYAPSGKKIGQWEIKANNASEGIDFRAVETGIYRFKYHSRGAIIKSRLPGCGYLADSPFRANGISTRMYFFVPAGVDEIALRVAGDNENEHVSANLLDPKGKIIQSIKQIKKPTLLYTRRAQADKSEIWSIQIVHAVDDFNIMILGKSLPVLSSSPDQVLKYK